MPDVTTMLDPPRASAASARLTATHEAAHAAVAAIGPMPACVVRTPDGRLTVAEVAAAVPAGR
jgi:hypothetical protein